MAYFIQNKQGKRGKPIPNLKTARNLARQLLARFPKDRFKVCKIVEDDEYIYDSELVCTFEKKYGIITEKKPDSPTYLSPYKAPKVYKESERITAKGIARSIPTEKKVATALSSGYDMFTYMLSMGLI